MNKKFKTPGEPLVWFSSLGLTIGLSMVIFLLAVIFANGIGVFWPYRVAEIKMKPGSEKSSVAARILKKVKNDQEWQLFLGNKDIYGQAFEFVSKNDVTQVSYPGNVLSMERLEYGEAIGFAKILEEKGGTQIESMAKEFDEKLGTLVDESRERWNQIRDTEKKQIGAINLKMERLNVRKRSIERSGSAATKQAEIQEIDSEAKTLQNQYDVLAKRASELRARQEEDFLTYRLASGEEKRLPVSQIVHFYYPNRISVFSRAGIFLQRIWDFLSEEPREANTEGGVFPAIFGTFIMTLLLSVVVTPFGVLAAIYLHEYAKQGVFVRAVRIAVNNLAGVPSIVFGVFGLGFFVYVVGGSIDKLFFSQYLPTPTFGTGGILWASLTLALLAVPVVIVSTEEALSAVPRGMREGSLACGASKWQTIQRVVIPASAAGILTGLILAMARGAGEVAPLMMVGVVKLAPTLPLDTTFPYFHLDQKFMHLGFHIYDLGFQSPDSDAARPMVFATTFLLILLVVVLNLAAIVIREKLRKKYSSAAF